MKIRFILPFCIEQFVPELLNPGRERILATRRQGFENGIASSVRQNGHEVFLYYMTNLCKREMRIAHRDGYQVIFIPASFHIFHLRYPFEVSVQLLTSMIREIRRGNVDVIHFHEYYSPMFFPISLVCYMHKVALVGHHHGGQPIGKNILRLFSTFVTMLSLHLSSKILVVHKEEKAKIVIKFRVTEDKIVLCPNAVNTNVFRPIPQETARIILNLSSKKKYLLFVGRLQEPFKGISNLLKAFKNVKQSIQDVSLMIVGDGPARAELINLSKTLGIYSDTHFVGSVVDQELIAAYYSSSDVVVVPSIREAFPLVPIEAMSCAKPVVASRVGGIKEAIRDKETGFLVSPGNITELEERILTLLTDSELRKRIGVAARKEIEQKYSLISYGNRLDRIYRGCRRRVRDVEFSIN